MRIPPSSITPIRISTLEVESPNIVQPIRRNLPTVTVAVVTDMVITLVALLSDRILLGQVTVRSPHLFQHGLAYRSRVFLSVGDGCIAK